MLCIYGFDLYSENEKNIERAKEILIACKTVTSNYISESGKPSRNAWAFTTIYQLAQKNGSNVFVEIIEKSLNNEGKIYALCALFRLDREKFNALSENYRLKKISVLWYCSQSEKESNFFFEKIKDENFFNMLLLFPIPEYEKTIEPD